LPAWYSTTPTVGALFMDLSWIQPCGRASA
jgi:hypothetical protein